MSSTKSEKPQTSTELVPVPSAPGGAEGATPVAPPHPMLLQRYRDSWKRAEADRPSRAEAEAAVETLLRWVGEDPAREGLRETPSRVVKAYEELFGGYRMDAGDVLGRTFEEVSGYDDMVLVKDISFHSHCEHHMVPIIGKAHVGYLPDGRVLGLSKIARLIDIYGRRLQTQESMTAQIAAAIVGVLQPKGVAVMIEAEHLCMSMRGIRSKGSTTVTTTFEGAFEQDADLRRRFLGHVAERGAS